MKSSQLPLFIRQNFDKVLSQQAIEPVAPTKGSSVMQTLPAYLAYLRSSGYSASTTEKYFSDVRRFSVFIREKKVGEITIHDIEQWIAGLLSPKGEKLGQKTVSRKVCAILSYFLWLTGLGVITNDPTATLTSQRVLSPLPDYLYEDEIKTLYKEASRDTRTYILVLLFLEAGIKSNELFGITTAHIDTSDPYRPEVWIKHAGRDVKKDRKVALPPQFGEVYKRYVAEYQIENTLFPYTDRFIQMLFADLKKRTGIAKELTPKTLRHTHVVRAYKRGEEPERVFDRIGLAPYSRQEADEMYSRLARRGI